MESILGCDQTAVVVTGKLEIHFETVAYVTHTDAVWKSRPSRKPRVQ